MRRKLAELALAFAPQSANHPLTITGSHAWRLKEPVSGRRYTVAKVQSQNGDFGFGKGGPTLAAAMVAALIVILLIVWLSQRPA